MVKGKKMAALEINNKKLIPHTIKKNILVFLSQK